MALLPSKEVGLSQECQGHVIRAGASCLPEIQSLATGIVMNPDVKVLIDKWEEDYALLQGLGGTARKLNFPELLQGLNGCFRNNSSNSSHSSDSNNNSNNSSNSSAPAGDAAVSELLAALDNPALPVILPYLTERLINTTLPMVRQLLPGRTPRA